MAMKSAQRQFRKCTTITTVSENKKNSLTDSSKDYKIKATKNGWAKWWEWGRFSGISRMFRKAKWWECELHSWNLGEIHSTKYWKILDIFMTVPSACQPSMCLSGLTLWITKFRMNANLAHVPLNHSQVHSFTSDFLKLWFKSPKSSFNLYHHHHLLQTLPSFFV